MKINTKLLSIPPYISTSWKNVLSLHVEKKAPDLEKKVFDSLLVIGLINGTNIEIPNLEGSVLETVFSMHARFLEQDTIKNKGNLPKAESVPNLDSSFGIDLPLKLGMEGLEGLGAILQHNPEQATAPDLPKEVLNKISSLSKMMGIQESSILPKGEPHCNCVHCQIARALHGTQPHVSKQESGGEEEIISDEELKFRIWDINQATDKLYVVSNPMDTKEYYNVYLGNPIGCTCGEKNCEHIRAVLNS